MARLTRRAVLRGWKELKPLWRDTLLPAIAGDLVEVAAPESFQANAGEQVRDEG